MIFDTMQDVLKQSASKVENLIEASRESRLRLEKKDKERGFFYRLFRTSFGRWVLKPLIEFIPSPVGYGPGDIITGISSISGKDILSGEKLDSVHRVLYGIATIIPYVPSLFVVEPVKLIRSGIEDIVHSRKEKNIPKTIQQSAETAAHAKKLFSLLKRK